jgi:hypothetical protein
MERTPSNPVDVVVTYQRPRDEEFHGGSAHFREFVLELQRSFTVRVVCPKARRVSRLTKPERDILTLVRNVASEFVETLRFLLEDGSSFKRRRPCLIIAFDFYSSYLIFLWAVLSGTPFVYYAQDSSREAVNAFRAQSRVAGLFLWTLRVPFERLVLLKSSLVIVVSRPLEKGLIASGVSRSRIVVLGINRSPSTPNQTLIAGWRSRTNSEGRVAIVFVGGLDYPPNAKAVDFIVKVLAPPMLKSRPRARFVLVGRGTLELSPTFPANVVGLGTVEDLENLLFSMNLGIAPMVAGGGVSGKVADYLLHGLTVVATPQSAIGAPKCSRLQTCSLSEFASVLETIVDAPQEPSLGFQTRLEEDVRKAYLTSSEQSLLIDRLSRIAAG